jgi:hypothetical protein
MYVDFYISAVFADVNSGVTWDPDKTCKASSDGMGCDWSPLDQIQPPPWAERPAQII